jgi:hypothetical protein
MDASQIVELRRQREIFASNYSASVGPIRKFWRNSGAAVATAGEVIAGGIQFYSHNTLIDQNILPVDRIETVVPIPPGPDPIQISLTLFEDLLTWIQTNKKGPTVTSRLIYIWTFTATAAWSAIQPAGMVRMLSGIHDNWNWDERIKPTVSTGTWLCQTLANTMSTFLPGYISSLAKPGASAWLSKWTTWWTNRALDGSNSLPTPTINDISNINFSINPSAGGIPYNINKKKWTPLLVNGKTQNYLTFFWKTVGTTCLTPEQEATIDVSSSAIYPTDDERKMELCQVADITGTLTDEQKIIAEFWAGGPGTATPPGMLAWFWAEYCRQANPSERVFFLSGLDLGIHLFEGSRITWGLKAKFCQARPIQEIRCCLARKEVKNWKGEPIIADNWIPYQESNFITPPFADFPSGHSHFSKAFALTMNKWFGSQVKYTPEKRFDLISPVLDPESEDLQVKPGASVIEPDLVPEKSIDLKWHTWNEIAEQAGMSRLYGGIHCISAHNGSQIAAIEAHKYIEENWGFYV